MWGGSAARASRPPSSPLLPSWASGKPGSNWDRRTGGGARWHRHQGVGLSLEGPACPRDTARGRDKASAQTQGSSGAWSADTCPSGRSSLGGCQEAPSRTHTPRCSSLLRVSQPRTSSPGTLPRTRGPDRCRPGRGRPQWLCSPVRRKSDLGASPQLRGDLGGRQHAPSGCRARFPLILPDDPQGCARRPPAPPGNAAPHISPRPPLPSPSCSP